jgi:plastocyanin
MSRTRVSKQPKSAESHSVAKDASEAEPKKAGQETISKSAAAKFALAEGYASPGDAVEFIKKRFGIEMDKQHFSAVKSQLKKKEAGASGRIHTEGYLAPPPRSRKGDEPDVLLALEAIKPLVEQYGADRVKRIVELLG